MEPDQNKVLNSELFSRTWRSVLEDSDIRAESIDLAYSAMVVEHVVDPEKFLSKVYEVLVPGGKFVAATISGWSYLGVATQITERFGIQDAVLSAMRGKESVEAYHYPAVYRMNREKSVKRVCDRIGFSKVRFAYSDNHASIVYWPRPLKWIGYALDAMNRRMKIPQTLNNMYILLEK